MRLKKERNELAFDIFGFIVDIRPGSEYPSYERNKHFSL